MYLWAGNKNDRFWVPFAAAAAAAAAAAEAGTGGLGSWRTSGDHPNYYITENGQNTEKSPGDLRRLADTQTLVKNHQLMLMWKTLKE